MKSKLGAIYYLAPIKIFVWGFANLFNVLPNVSGIILMTIHDQSLTIYKIISGNVCINKPGPVTRLQKTNE